MKILFVSNYSAYGDQINVKGMIDFLSLYYDKIFILVSWNFISPIEDLYINNNKVFPMSYDYFVTSDIRNDVPGQYECLCLLNEEYLELDSTFRLSDGQIPMESAVMLKDFLDRDIVSEVYSQKNPIGHKFGFNIPRIKNSDMISEFYNKLGFPDEIKYKCFNFFRNEEDENNLIKKLNLPSSYAVVCEYDKHPNQQGNVLNLSTKLAIFDSNNTISRKFIKSDYIVNLHMLSEKYFDLIKLIENAEEVHLIENSLSMLVYFLQLSGRMEKIPINFHTYYRKEESRKDNYKSYMNPKLDNWTFIVDSE